MRLLILTGKDHFHANLMLRLLATDTGAREDTALIIEQETLLSGRTKWRSLASYLRSAGLRYVAGQVMRQYAFRALRALASLMGERSSASYPYQREMPATWRRRVLNGLAKPETQQVLREFAPDAVLSVFSRERLPPEVLRLPTLGCINVHPAWLPEYRGVSPTFWCLADGAENGGVTLHWMDADFDTGRILARARIPTLPYRTEHGFYTACVLRGAQLLVELLRRLRTGDAPPGKPQEEGKGEYRALPSREAVRRFYGRGLRQFRFGELLSFPTQLTSRQGASGRPFASHESRGDTKP